MPKKTLCLNQHQVFTWTDCPVQDVGGLVGFGRWCRPDSAVLDGIWGALVGSLWYKWLE